MEAPGGAIKDRYLGMVEVVGSNTAKHRFLLKVPPGPFI